MPARGCRTGSRLEDFDRALALAEDRPGGMVRVVVDVRDELLRSSLARAVSRAGLRAPRR